jgi:hypothetical protein
MTGFGMYGMYHRIVKEKSTEYMKSLASETYN